MHTRHSKRTSPLTFDPEIERTARRNRVNYRVQHLGQPATTQNINKASSSMSNHSNRSHHSHHTNQGDVYEPYPDLDQPPIQHAPRQQNPEVQQPASQHQHGQFRAADDQHRYNPPPNRAASGGLPANRNHQERPQRRANSVYNEDAVRERVDEWDDGEEFDDVYDDGEFDDTGSFQEGYRYRPNQRPPFNRNHNPRYEGPQRRNQPRANQYNRGGYVPHNNGVQRGQNRPPVQGVDSHFRPQIAVNTSPVVGPEVRGRSFEVKQNCLNNLPQFYGKSTEEPYSHISEFDAMCSTIGRQGFTADQVKLVLFQFTLKDTAKQWFLALPSASIYTWENLQQ